MVLRKISAKKLKSDKGQVMIINLLFLLMTLAVMVALIPQLTTLLNLAQQSDYLNCKGYAYLGDPNNVYSYNASLKSNTLACISIDLYLPYIIMAVLIAGVSRVILGRITTESGI
jgi:hypothetical protein